MFSLRLAGAALGFALLNSQLTTCRSPGEGSSEAAPAHAEVKDVTPAGGGHLGADRSRKSGLVAGRLGPARSLPGSAGELGPVRERK